MKLTGRRRLPAVVSLTPLVDVVLILLIFFMVTSSYLNLEALLVAAGGAEEPGRPAPQTAPGPAMPGGDSAESDLLFVRLGADGRVRGPGFDVPATALGPLRGALSRYARAVVLPSGAASLQNLVDALDGLGALGIPDVSVVRIGSGS